MSSKGQIYAADTVQYSCVISLSLMKMSEVLLDELLVSNAVVTSGRPVWAKLAGTLSPFKCQSYMFWLFVVWLSL